MSNLWLHYLYIANSKEESVHNTLNFTSELMLFKPAVCVQN